MSEEQQLQQDIRRRRRLIAVSQRLIAFWTSKLAWLRRHPPPPPPPPPSPWPQQGVDYAYGRPDYYQLRLQGCRFVGRYLGGTADKDITRGEAAAIHAQGMHVLLFFEDGARNAWGAARTGGIDAIAACRQAHALGVPERIVIYFCVDDEVKDADGPIVRSYLQAVKRYCELHGYTAGCYGGLNTMAIAREAGITHLCQTLAWSGGRWDPDAAVRQYRVDVHRAGVEVDLLEARAPFGGWAP